MMGFSARVILWKSVLFIFKEHGCVVFHFREACSEIDRFFFGCRDEADPCQTVCQSESPERFCYALSYAASTIFGEDDHVLNVSVSYSIGDHASHADCAILLVMGDYEDEASIKNLRDTVCTPSHVPPSAGSIKVDDFG